MRTKIIAFFIMLSLPYLFSEPRRRKHYRDRRNRVNPHAGHYHYIHKECSRKRIDELKFGVISHVVHVVGQKTCVKLTGATSLITNITADVEGYDAASRVSVDIFYPTAPISFIHVYNASKSLNDIKVVYNYKSSHNELISQAEVHITAVIVSLDVDTDRDGLVEFNSTFKNSWQWGPSGHGAIIIPNVDRDRNHAKLRDSDDEWVSGSRDLNDLSPVVIRTDGPPTLPPDYSMFLFAENSKRDVVRIFKANLNSFGQIQSLENILNPSSSNSVNIPYRGRRDVKLYAEAMKFPDGDFDGHFHLYLGFYKGASLIYKDTILFTVTPWIMMPNTLQTDTIYGVINRQTKIFLAELQHIIEDEPEVQIRMCPKKICNGDRWIQDQLEFGYAEMPQRYPMAVVLSSPRDTGKGLNHYGAKQELGPNVGFVDIFQDDNHSDYTELDYFGNLEVSPPVTVDGIEYPLGRILIGNGDPGYAADARLLSDKLWSFLEAQKVQSPVQLYSDWLYVGHVDEFVTFVPANNSKGFKVVLASPQAFYDIIDELMENKRTRTLKLFSGKKHAYYQGKAAISVHKIATDDMLYSDNMECQHYIDMNREILMNELGITSEDIVEIPVLFLFVEDTIIGSFRASSYFPNMVNMLVVNNQLVIPKPFGPIVNGEDVLEAYVRKQFEPYGLTTHFVDDWNAFHIFDGGIHCGTNQRRKPFRFKWWNVKVSQ